MLQRKKPLFYAPLTFFKTRKEYIVQTSDLSIRIFDSDKKFY